MRGGEIIGKKGGSHTERGRDYARAMVLVGRKGEQRKGQSESDSLSLESLSRNNNTGPKISFYKIETAQQGCMCVPEFVREYVRECERAHRVRAFACANNVPLVPMPPTQHPPLLSRLGPP